MSAEIISDLGTQCQKSRKIPQSLGWRTKSDDLSAEIWQSTGGGNRGLAHFKLSAWVFQDFKQIWDSWQRPKLKSSCKNICSSCPDSNGIFMICLASKAQIWDFGFGHFYLFVFHLYFWRWHDSQGFEKHHASSTTDWCRVQPCRGFPDATLLFFLFCISFRFSLYY